MLAKVAELMHAHVPRLREDATLRDAADKLELYQVAGLPVVDEDGTVLGVVTQHDLVELLFPEGDASTVPQAASSGSAPVAGIMATPAITIEEGASATEALELMLRTGIHVLPVVNDGKLSGTISRSALCQAALMGTLGKKKP